jgi:hypothetical protein
MVRGALLRGSLYRRRRRSPVLLHRSRGRRLVPLLSHTTQRGVLAVPSPLVRALVSVLSRARSSLTLSVVGVAAGCATGCSGIVCLAMFCSSVAGSVGLELNIVPGSTSEAVLQKINSNITTLKIDFTKKILC